MNPRVLLILAGISLLPAGCVCCPGPYNGQPGYRAMMPHPDPPMPRPLINRSVTRVRYDNAAHKPAAVAPIPTFPRAPRFRRHAAERPQSQPNAFLDIKYPQTAHQPMLAMQPADTPPRTRECDSCHDNRQRSWHMVPTQKTCRCEKPACAHCAPPLECSQIRSTHSRVATLKNTPCHCQKCQLDQHGAQNGCTDCQQPLMMGLPHHQPFNSQSYISQPAQVTTERNSIPVDVTADVMEEKSVNDVVPAPVPPADPEPFEPPAAGQTRETGRPPTEKPIEMQRRPAAPVPEPEVPAEDQVPTFRQPRTDGPRVFQSIPEPVPADLDAETGRSVRPPVTTIQPMALWIPQGKTPPAVTPIPTHDQTERVTLPRTRVSTKRIQ